MAKSAPRNPTQKKKAERGYPYKFKRPMEEPSNRPSNYRCELQQKYEDSARKALSEQFGYKNPLQVPKLEKITLNIGLGEALKTPKLLEQAFESLGLISGQRPVVTRAKKSIAGFKLREGMKLGCMVTLRGHRMWEFLDRLQTVALPRTRDFRGVSRKAFDGRGNYTLGIREILIFPEIDIEKLEKVPGMNVCIHTSAKTDEEGRALLSQLGMPFRAA
jgi:large subunit ribosomal protein L5